MDASSWRPVPIQYDESKWPFVIVTLPAHELSNAEFATHLNRVSSYFDRHERFGLLFDARGTSNPDAERRRAIAARMDKDLQRHGELSIGTAVVLSSAVHRGVFKVVMWLRRSSHPMMAFSTVESALAWLRGLQRMGVARSTDLAG